MVSYCVCMGCTNSNLSRHRVFRFPDIKLTGCGWRGKCSCSHQEQITVQSCATPISNRKIISLRVQLQKSGGSLKLASSYSLKKSSFCLPIFFFLLLFFFFLAAHRSYQQLQILLQKPWQLLLTAGNATCVCCWMHNLNLAPLLRYYPYSESV